VVPSNFQSQIASVLPNSCSKSHSIAVCQSIPDALGMLAFLRAVAYRWVTDVVMNARQKQQQTDYEWEERP